MGFLYAVACHLLFTFSLLCLVKLIRDFSLITTDFFDSFIWAYLTVWFAVGGIFVYKIW